MKSGILYGTGVGPGDPELITLKAVRIIESSPVIAVPIKDKLLTKPYFMENIEQEMDTSKRDCLLNCLSYYIASQTIEKIEKKKFLLLPMPMIRDKNRLQEAHQSASFAIAKQLEKGRDIAFLTLGDPCIYSTYLYVHREILKKGFLAEIISGVPSFCAASAKLSEGLVENREELHIIPASYPVEEALKLSGTKVLMKAGKQMVKVKELLKNYGLQENVFMVENCGLSGERICKGISEINENLGYYSLVIIK